jgi:hypothetical protein
MGKKGMDWLKRERPILFRHTIPKEQKIIGRLFLEHALLVSDIMVAAEVACRGRRDVRILSAAGSDQFVPSQWSVNVAGRLKCRVVPDAVFGLEYRGKQCWYFLEADRGTMPVTRRSLQSSSLRRKFACYIATWEQKIHQSFGIRRFRVLTVTAKPDRVETMIKVCRENVQAGRGLFLFATADALRKRQDFWAVPWQTAYSDDAASLLN